MPKPLNLSPEVQAGLDAMNETRPTPEAPEFDPRLLGQLSATGIHIDSDPERMTDSDPSNPDTLTPLSPENKLLLETLLVPQTETALKAHNTLSDSLSGASHTTVEQLTHELFSWLTDGKLDYVRGQIEQNPDLRFTLVATPNVLPKDHAEVFAAAKGFGKAAPGSPQAYDTWIYDEEMNGDLYGKYSLQQLAGTDPDSGNAIQFSLMPSKPTPELANMTTQEQRQIFQNDLQPSMNNLKVPSVLEAITYWHTLRNQLPKAPDNSGNMQLQQLAGFDLTYIRHFDLPDQSVGGYSLVPCSYVNDVGEPVLDRSSADNAVDARLSVG